MSFILKPLYEAHEDVKQLGVYFSNDGAGSAVVFPGELNDGTNEGYTSIGCDWMAANNPVANDGTPIGSPEARRRCHAKNTKLRCVLTGLPD